VESITAVHAPAMRELRSMAIDVDTSLSDASMSTRCDEDARDADDATYRRDRTTPRRRSPMTSPSARARSAVMEQPPNTVVIARRLTRVNEGEFSVAELTMVSKFTSRHQKIGHAEGHA
jgi:hypothetical protein